MKKLQSMLIMILIIFVLTACGETVRGVGRDISRIAHGTKTIFISN